MRLSCSLSVIYVAGFLRSLVFTHLPSSLFLIAVPFASSSKWADLALSPARKPGRDGRADPSVVCRSAGQTT